MEKAEAKLLHKEEEDYLLKSNLKKNEIVPAFKKKNISEWYIPADYDHWANINLQTFFVS